MVKSCVRRTNAFNCGLGLFHVVACPQLNLLHSSFFMWFSYFCCWCHNILQKSLFSLSLQIIVYICPSKVETNSSHEAYKCHFFLSQTMLLWSFSTFALQKNSMLSAHLRKIDAEKGHLQSLIAYQYECLDMFLSEQASEVLPRITVS